MKIAFIIVVVAMLWGGLKLMEITLSGLDVYSVRVE